MEIVNSTASFRLSERLDLCILHIDNFSCAQRNRGFDALSLRLFPISFAPVTALIYSSGAVVLVGGRSLAQIEAAKAEVVKLTKVPAATALVLHNLACSFTHCKRVRLPHLVTLFREDDRFENVMYEPELFPALTLNLKGTKRKACIFSSGKVNLVGNKNIEEADQMRVALITILSQ